MSSALWTVQVLWGVFFQPHRFRQDLMVQAGALVLVDFAPVWYRLTHIH